MGYAWSVDTSQAEKAHLYNSAHWPVYSLLANEGERERSHVFLALVEPDDLTLASEAPLRVHERSPARQRTFSYPEPPA